MAIFFKRRKIKKIELQETAKSWERMDHANASRIEYIIKGRNWKDDSKWDELHSEMTDTMIRFKRAISPNIHKIETL